MRPHLCRTIALLPGIFLISGCTADQAAARFGATPADLPSISSYYARATAHQRRAVRKPVRDRRDLALRELAKSAQALLAQSATWDSDVRLVSLAETERPPAREAVAEFRASLADLYAAADHLEMTAVHREYARTLSSYRHLTTMYGPLD